MTITTPLNGTPFATIEGDTHIGRWAIESGRLDHDQNTLPLLAQHIPKGATVLDIGAYIGDHTVYYAQCAEETGTVIAIEPNPEAFECLKFNTGSLNVRSLNVGVSDRPGIMGLAVDQNGGASRGTPTGNIPLITIDSLNIQRLDLLKMDCEGMEPLALLGATDTIRRTRPVMLIEVNEGALNQQGFTQKSIYQIVDGLGYTYRNVHADELMEGPQYDILCLPISSPE